MADIALLGKSNNGGRETPLVCVFLMPSTSDKPTDKISLAQALRWIERRTEDHRLALRGRISRASMNQLLEALKSGEIKATGCVDGRRREPISAEEWQDYDLVLRHVIIPNAHFVNAPPTPVVEALSKRSYPAAAVDLHHRQSALRLPSAKSATGEPGYRRVIDDVLLSREDVVTHWPANGTLASAPRPKQRRTRTRPARAAAVAAIAEIYPESVPDQVAVPNAALCKKVAATLKGGPHEKISDDTILRAAGRRRY